MAPKPSHPILLDYQQAALALTLKPSDQQGAKQSQLQLCLRELPLMAIDLETTGLDPNTEQIVSIGLVPIYGAEIPLAKAQHRTVAINGGVGNSATFHGLSDSALAKGMALDEAMAWFITESRGHILVAHNAPLDLGFIQVQFERLYQSPCPLPFIDTLAIAKRRWLSQHSVLKQDCLRLDACRKRHGLPTYAAHSAQIDALACAELLVAQMAAIAGKDKLSPWQLLQFA
ncbi:3'-5' exonuclease [Shewanella sp. SR44-3]|uniref:3'-5' exonuclease n=1 Tax=unclassified Shewanella TaxID=196818 RepID=UPI0021759B61|nr:3'-5' exonuclease [Shewanella sp. SR44-3]